MSAIGLEKVCQLLALDYTCGDNQDPPGPLNTARDDWSSVEHKSQIIPNI